MESFEDILPKEYTGLKSREWQDIIILYSDFGRPRYLQTRQIVHHLAA